MNVIKKLFNFVNNRASTAIENATKPEERTREASRLIVSKMGELRHKEIDGKKQIAKTQALIDTHAAEHRKKEDQILELLKSEQEVPQNLYVLSVQHRNIAEGLKGKLVKSQEAADKIPEYIVNLDRRLADVRMQQEVQELATISKELGIDMPEDLQASIDHDLANVDTILLEMEVLNGGDKAFAVNAIDVSVYKAQLTGK